MKSPERLIVVKFSLTKLQTYTKLICIQRTIYLSKTKL